MRLGGHTCLLVARASSMAVAIGVLGTIASFGPEVRLSKQGLGPVTLGVNYLRTLAARPVIVSIIR
jgi:hypothetical protein